MYKIIAYIPAYQRGIDEMMREIALEFEEPITSPVVTGSPGLPDGYWIALADNVVAGTTGIISPDNKYAVLKRMMVRKAFRGKEYGIAAALLQQAVDWSRAKGCPTLYLGTMRQFKAAQQFYTRHGFSVIPAAALPADFPHNPLDTVFYKLELK